MLLTTRFAPSPTAIYISAMLFLRFLRMRRRGPKGGGLLRIEDIDPARCKPEFAEALLEDLRWLGLESEEPVRRQSSIWRIMRRRSRSSGLWVCSTPAFARDAKSRMR